MVFFGFLAISLGHCEERDNGVFFYELDALGPFKRSLNITFLVLVPKKGGRGQKI